MPIHLACQNLKKNAILAVIEKSSKIDVADQSQKYPIHYLIDNKNLSDADKIEILSKFAILELETRQKNRIIHTACMKKSKELIQYLIDRKLSLDVPQDSDSYPIHLLFKNENLTEADLMELLEKFTNLEHANAKGYRAIHLACRQKKSELIRYLVGRNVDLNSASNTLICPIHYLCMNPVNIPTIILFVEKGIDLNCSTISGKKPIHYLMQSGKISMLKYLLDHGAVAEDFDLKKVAGKKAMPREDSDDDDDDNDNDDDDNDDDEEDD